ncbi:RNA polymerase sigma-70 factor [Parapedobacter tibetensis]|uniref:RNA polymerase sigma-70 factor n=1 Tax=Parapedobacter tibetensis TaxID=2972951 RepID=UPI00214D4D74|nr:RNA polymerase sigma-70 factor [Parapedobacter tibetensis]
MADYGKYTDQELFPLLKAGDDLAFKALYLRYWKKLLYFAAQKTGDFADAENIVQDIFVSLWEKRETLRLTSTLDHYLFVSVKYRVIKLLDRKRSQRLHADRNAATHDILDDSTQQYLDFEELRHRLEELIGTLPEKSELIYRMNKEEGMSHKEIGSELGMSEKAVNARLVRIKKTLRTGLNSFLGGFLL